MRCKKDGGSEKKALSDGCAAGRFLEGQQECALLKNVEAAVCTELRKPKR